LACGTFPLILMGGMVTSFGAGMAVPDWPSTYGYNLFLYPLASWLHVGDVCLEHSHRLIGASVGMITIALVVLLWACDRRRWVRWWGVATLAGVCYQGVLGGLRVTQRSVLLADLHGCTAPLFFAMCVCLVSVTSPRWQAADRPQPHPDARRLGWLAFTALVAIYLQIVLGAQVRHLPPTARPFWFSFWFWPHLVLALALVLGVAALVWYVRRISGGPPMLRRRAWLLLGLLGVQFCLGLAVWVTRFGLPAWFTDYVWAIQYTVVAGSRWQGLMRTAHVGVGSLTLAAALSLTLWTGRLLRK
jgi:cytochrome c oxidase assembly protein subunit 15